MGTGIGVRLRPSLRSCREKITLPCKVKAAAHGPLEEETVKANPANRISTAVLVILSLVALSAVLSGFGHPFQRDEGAAAHVFQLSIAALVPVGLVFLATANWRRPIVSARLLALPAVIVAAAFVALYFLEHRA